MYESVRWEASKMSVIIALSPMTDGKSQLCWILCWFYPSRIELNTTEHLRKITALRVYATSHFSAVSHLVNRLSTFRVSSAGNGDWFSSKSRQLMVTSNVDTLANLPGHWEENRSRLSFSVAERHGDYYRSIDGRIDEKYHWFLSQLINLNSWTNQISIYVLIGVLRRAVWAMGKQLT